MNPIGFSNRYRFVRYNYGKSHYTDNRTGAPMHYLAYMAQGQCRILSEQGVLEVSAGEAFYIPMGLSYQSYWASEEEICFHSYGFVHFPEAEQKPYRLQRLPSDLARQVSRIPLARQPGCGELSVLYGVLAALTPSMEAEQTGESQKILELATEYIHRNPHCSIPEVARHCCVSESALYGIFKKQAGQTPNDTKQAILAEKAVRLLSTTNLSVQQISDALCFSSPSYFRKILKKHTGKTPRQIRKEVVSL